MTSKHYKCCLIASWRSAANQRDIANTTAVKTVSTADIASTVAAAAANDGDVCHHAGATACNGAENEAAYLQLRPADNDDIDWHSRAVTGRWTQLAFCCSLQASSEQSTYTITWRHGLLRQTLE